MIPSSLVGLFASAFLLIAGNGLLSTLIPLRGRLEGLSPVEIGLIGSSYFFGMLLGTFAAPLIIRQLGYVGAFGVLLAVAVASATAFPIAFGPMPWLLFRGLMGFVFAGLYAIIEGWLSARSRDANRGRVYAVYQIMTFAGSAIGQQVLGLAPARSPLLFIGAAACYALAIVPLVAARSEPPRRPREVRLRLIWFIRASPIGGAVAIAVGAANGSFYALAPVYGLGLGLGSGAVATFMTAVTIGTAVAIYPVAYLSDARDRRIVIVVFAALGSAAEFLLARTSAASHGQLWGTAMAVGATSFVLYTLGYAHANDRIETDQSVVVSSSMLFLYCVGAVAAPVLASLSMSALGVGALFVQNGAVHAGLAAFVLWRMFRRPSAVRSAPAQPSPRSTPRDAV